MSVNHFVDVCPNCGESTCLNNVSTRPPYHNLECWACGWFSIAERGFMSEAEKEELRKYMEDIE
jgi:ribosomal protein L32|tara:strand:- start:1935 stop:2126 length:192 start_codon:yes stop_codon:yes gene_type:complete